MQDAKAGIEWHTGLEAQHFKRGFKGKSGPSGTAGSSHQVLETVVVRDLQGVQLTLHFPFQDERVGVA